MDRRGFLAGLGALVGAIPLGWSRRAEAGGDGFGHGHGSCGGIAAMEVEEEFLDLGALGSSSSTELSHFFSEHLDASAQDRFLVAERGTVLVYADLETFHISANGTRLPAVRAPNGGRILFNASSSTVVFRLHGAPYDPIIVVDPKTASQEFWDDALNLRAIAPSKLGIVTSHERQYGSRGQLSLTDGPMGTKELVRLDEVPSVVAVNAERVSYFLGERAFSLTIGETTPPVFVAALPTPPLAAVATPSGIIATTEDGAWSVSREGRRQKLIAESSPQFLFTDRGRTIVASSRRAFVLGTTTQRRIEFSHDNLHFIAPIDNSDDLLLCRGPSVIRYHAKSGRLETIGQGRTGMKLRGAAFVGEQLLTWSSRTWRVTSGGGCTVVRPPQAYLVD